MVYPGQGKLLAQPEVGDDLVVAADVLATQIAEHPATLADEFEKAELGMKVLAVRRHVAGQFVDSAGQYGYLDFSGARILALAGEFADDLGFLGCIQVECSL